MPRLEEIKHGEAFIYDQQLFGIRLSARQEEDGAIRIVIIHSNILNPDGRFVQKGTTSCLSGHSWVERADLDVFVGEGCVYRTWSAEKLTTR